MNGATPNGPRNLHRPEELLTGAPSSGTTSPVSHFMRSARVVSLLTLISRISGFMRDIAFSYFFGATGVASAFTVAFTIPNLFRRLFGEGALSAALIPALSKRLHEQGLPGTGELAGRVFSWLGVVVSGLVLVGELVLLLIWLLVAQEGIGRLAASMTALLLPYAVLICLTAAMGGALNVLGRFAVPASSPILLNLILIATLLGAGALRPNDVHWRIWVLAGAVLLAGVMQVLWQGGALRRSGLPVRWVLERRHPGLREVVLAMIPSMIGLAAVQINALSDVMVALLCIDYEGAPSVLYYAQRLYHFPLGVFSIAFATAVFPTLSAHAAAGEHDALRDAVVKSTRVVLYVGVAASLGLLCVARPLVQGFFERGAFTPEDTRRVSLTLMAYAAGVWAYGLNHILIRAYYAMGDRRTPMKVALVMVAINLTLNLTLVWRFEEAGLGAATATTAAIQFLWLGAILAGRFKPVPWGELLVSAGRILAAGAVLATALLLLHAWMVGRNEDVGPIRLLVVLVPVGIVTYLLATTMLRSRELREIMTR